MLVVTDLQKTEDGGHTWKKVHTPMDGLQGSLRAFHFERDRRLGWIAGGIFYKSDEGCPNNASGRLPDNTRTCLNGAVFRTGDGGESWHQQLTPRRVGRFLSISFVDSIHGWLAGDAGVLFTTNGGASWGVSEFGRRCKNLFELQDIGPTEAYFIDEKRGWLTFSGGLVAKSTNGGKTWCDLFDPNSLWPDDASYVGPDREIIIVHFKNANEGLGLAADGLLYETKNGGAKWQKEGTEIRFELVKVLDELNGWALSREGELFKLHG
jgi:photosystem II stability/assembly factor-like uncharacterized protein